MSKLNLRNVRKPKRSNPKSRGNWQMGAGICKVCRDNVTKNYDGVCDECRKQ